MFLIKIQLVSKFILKCEEIFLNLQYKVLMELFLCMARLLQEKHIPC